MAPTEKPQPQGGSVVIPMAALTLLLSLGGSYGVHKYGDAPAQRVPQEFVERMISLEQRVGAAEGKVTQIQIDASGNTRELAANLASLTATVRSLEEKIDRLTDRRNR